MQRFSWLIISLSIFVITIFFSYCSEEGREESVQNTEETGYLNLGDDAHYVGTSQCISCHRSIHHDFIHTGKGRAFHPVDPENIVEDFSNVHVYDKWSGYHYTAFWRSDSMIVREYRLRKGDTVYSREVNAEFVIGSGNQTRSYLFEENGYFYEIPITWYVKKAIWDLSPGYENGANTRFSRPISEMCMNCHNSDFEFVDNSVNRFLQVGDGIGCEKCHGPGSIHMQMVSSSDYDREQEIDYSIVNPAHLSLELQFDVCRQCHLEGVAVPKQGKDFVDFRPGMRMNDFWEVFIPVNSDASDFGFASHVERLQMSECFKMSDGKMNCTTCHDAHKPLAENAVLFYNEKCQNCHSADACGVEHQKMKSASENCIACHMPKDGTTDIPHVSTSDHFIRIHGDSIPVQGNEDGIKEFRNFTSEKSSHRDIFLANMEYYEKVEQNMEYLERVSGFISEVERKQAIKFYYLKRENAPLELLKGDAMKEDDAYTAFYIGELRSRQGMNGLEWTERAVELAPDNLEFAVRLAAAYLDRENLGKAKLTYLSILNKNSLEISALVNLGYIYQLEGNFPEALKLTQKALSLDPLYLRARENLVNIYLNIGDMNLAISNLNELIEDYPANAQYRELSKKLKNNPALF